MIADFNDELNDGSMPSWNAIRSDFDYMYGLTCIFTGCYELPNNRGTYRLEDTSCYIGRSSCNVGEFFFSSLKVD